MRACSETQIVLTSEVETWDDPVYTYRIKSRFTPPPEKKTHPKTYNNSTVEIGIMNIEQALEGQQVNINVCIHVVYQNK